MIRRCFICTVALLSSLCFAPATSRCEDSAKAVASGLSFLAKRQLKDGTFPPGKQAGHASAVTALAGLAFLESGSTSKEGEYAKQIKRCRKRILSWQNEDGFIGHERRGTMYHHAYATMFLARSAQLDKSKKVREPLKKAVDLIVRVQDDKGGGWRYRPVKHPGDLSVTSCQVVALRMADEARAGVPEATYAAAKQFLMKCRRDDGGFAYMPSLPGNSGYARTAAALTSLQSCGSTDKQVQQAAVRYLLAKLPTELQGTPYFFYGGHYAVQAAKNADQETFDKVHKSLGKVLLSEQKDDGSWDSNFGPDYSTAMACLILQAKRE